MSVRFPQLAGLTLLLGVLTPTFAQGQSPTAEQALKLKPRQADIPYDLVDPKDVGACQLKQLRRGDGEGFLVTGPTGEILRWFADTNGDKELDRWCFYAGGVEVYRDIDSDFDKTADQYRWLGTAGTRWGVDANQDGKIDSWKMISAEEVTQEVVEAVKRKDSKRFSALLIAPEELEAIGLGKEKNTALAARVEAAVAKFSEFISGQKVVDAQSTWAHFGADKPGLIPAGTDGSTKDIVVYENVVAMTESAAKPAGSQQLLVGTLVQVGPAWRLVDVPREVTEGTVLSDEGLFFNSAGGLVSSRSGDKPEANDLAMKKAERLMENLEKIEKSLESETDAKEKARLHDERADVMERLIADASTPEDRDLWIRQFVDTVGSAVQTNEYPRGLERLDQLAEKLKDVGLTEEQFAYIAFQRIRSNYTLKIQVPDANFEAVQKEYLSELTEFVDKYPKANDAAEAMVTIAMSSEFEGKSADAMDWYGKASTDFAGNLWGQKAGGALTRLKLEGKTLPAITGTDIDGRKLDLSIYQGRPMVLHFWASWCEPCKADMQVLKELQSRLAKRKLAIVGINLDNDPKTAVSFVKQGQYAWPHLQTKGGLDSQIAVQLGILTLPVTIVVDEKGKVLRSNVHSAEIEKLLK